MTTDPIDRGQPAQSPPAVADGVSRRPGHVVPPGPRRDDDRRVVVWSVAIAGAFIAAAALAATVQLATGATVAPWLPIHLALAGGASTAIAGVMPFFVAALSAGRPAPLRVRATAVALVASGALLVSLRAVAPGAVWPPVVGGVAYLCGIGATAVAVRDGGRGGLMARRPIVRTGYVVALGNVAIGATLGILAAAGWLPVVERWASLRPAHAWTNVIGFVSVVIVATMLHFLPTVLGTRIVPRRAADVAVLGPAIGSPIVVLGLATGWGMVAAAGLAITLVGAAALAIEVLRTARSRGRWTTDPGWHLVAEGGLLAGVAWFCVGVTLASGRVLAAEAGVAPEGWMTAIVGAPLAIGWIVQVLIASWTHLLPSVGPGGPPEHARQRAILGRGAGSRLLALNAGTGLLAVGWPTGLESIAVAGLAAIVGAVGASILLAIAALRVRAAR